MTLADFELGTWTLDSIRRNRHRRGSGGPGGRGGGGERGRRTLLLEKNRRPGVKILMSGGTRCNLTHATDKWGIIRAYGEQGNFLHSALAALVASRPGRS